MPRRAGAGEGARERAAGRSLREGASAHAAPSYKIVKDIASALAQERENADDDGGAYLRGSEYYENLGNTSDDPEEGEE